MRDAMEKTCRYQNDSGALARARKSYDFVGMGPGDLKRMVAAFGEHLAKLAPDGKQRMRDCELDVPGVPRLGQLLPLKLGGNARKH